MAEILCGVGWAMRGSFHPMMPSGSDVADSIAWKLGAPNTATASSRCIGRRSWGLSLIAEPDDYHAVPPRMTTTRARAAHPANSSMAGGSDSVLQNWLSLSTVQALFAADLPWYASKLSRADLSDAGRASILDFRVFFRCDVKQMSSFLRPDREFNHLSEDAAKELEIRLDKILQLFESQIDDDVLAIQSRRLNGEKVCTPCFDLVFLVFFVSVLLDLPLTCRDEQGQTSGGQRSYVDALLGFLQASLRYLHICIKHQTRNGPRYRNENRGAGRVSETQGS